MCSEFMSKTSSREVEEALGVPVVVNLKERSWDKVIKFSGAAPTLAREGTEIACSERVFPVSPFPNSRLSGFENQSDGNDDKSADTESQIQRIYERPRWKKTFSDLPLLVPMTSFTEYAYWGPMEGSALEFSIPDEKVFFAAAIGIKPFVPKTGRENGFSILTHTASKQMLDYHQRLIVILKASVAAGYLEEMSPRDRFNYLIENRYTSELAVRKIRNMAKGWEKRIPVQIAKLDRETEYRKFLKSEDVQG